MSTRMGGLVWLLRSVFNGKNPDFLLKNPDFLLKNPDFIIKQGGIATGHNNVGKALMEVRAELLAK